MLKEFRKMSWILISAGYLLIALVYFYPHILKFGTDLPGAQQGDLPQFLWNIWHFAKSILAFQNPFYAGEIFHPINTSIVLHTFTPAKCLLAFPIYIFLGVIQAYNVVFYFTFVAAALGAYYLIQSYVGDWRPAFIGGVIFAFAPNQIAHALGHLNVISIEAIPWILFIWKKYRASPTLAKQSLLVILNAYLLFCDYQLFVFVGFLSLLYLGYQYFWVKPTVKEVFVKFLKILVPFLIVLIPFWIMVLMTLKQFNPMQIHGERWDVSLIGSLDALSIFIPSIFHPLWGKFMYVPHSTIYTGPNGSYFSGAEHMGFLGYSVLIFVIVAIVKHWKSESVRSWTFAGLIFYLFALGPILRIGGIALNSISNFYLFSFHTVKVIFPMPYTLIHYLPIINGVRTPSRFIAIVILAAAILFAFGLQSWLHKQNTQRMKNVIFAIILAAVLFEFLPAPYWTAKFEIPGIYKIIKADNDHRNVVLDIPTPPWAYYDLRPLYYQTFHEHTIVGGWTARESSDQNKYFWDYHLIKTINLENSGVTAKEFTELLERLEVTYLVARSDISISAIRKISPEIPGLHLLSDLSAKDGVLWKYQR